MSDEKQIISEERARALLEAYGGNPDAWPAEQRQAMSARIAASAELQRARAGHRQLDGLLENDRAAAAIDHAGSSDLAARILAQLPDQPWSSSASGRGWLNRLRWPLTQPLWAAATAVAVIVGLVMLQTAPGPSSERSPSMAFEEWAWQDITGQSLDHKTDPQLDVLDLIELESAIDDA
jgi:hypothetical protein